MALASDTTILFASNQKQDLVDVKASDLGIREPRILPGSVWYGVKELWRGIVLSLKFNETKKAESLLRQANERLYEIRILSQKKKDVSDKLMNRSLEKYVSDLKKAQELSDTVNAVSPKLNERIQEEFVRQRLFEILQRQLSTLNLSEFQQQSLQEYAKFLFREGTDAGKEKLQEYVDENIKFDAKSLQDTKILEKAQTALADKENQRVFGEIREYAVQKIIENLQTMDQEEQSRKIQEFLNTTTTETVSLDPKSIIDRIIEEKERLDSEFRQRLEKESE